MTVISPDEISSIIKNSIENYGAKTEVSNVGSVLAIGDGIAHVYGLRNVMSNELVESTMFDIVDKKSKEFLTKWVNNTKKDTQFILEEAIAKGIIRKEHTQYWYGTDMFADSLDDAIAYLDSKKNQDLKLSIINEIKNK